MMIDGNEAVQACCDDQKPEKAMIDIAETLESGVCEYSQAIECAELHLSEAARARGSA
jgi:hypothetical protein